MMSAGHNSKNDVLLRVENLGTIVGDGVRAVDGIGFEIRRGEIFALLGESGCGKSITALSIMRLLPPSGRITGGRVQLDGQDLLQLPEAQMRAFRGGRIAMIFQEPATSLNPVMMAGEQVAESLRRHLGLSSRAARSRAEELFDAVGIPDPRRRVREYPHQLSGGMKQRVMIAMALAGEPELLIADEPTTALDVTIQAQVLDLLVNLQRDTGMAILFITHDLGIVSAMADDVAVMYAGQIVEQAPCRELFNQPSHPYTRKLLESLPGIEKRSRRLAVIPGSVPELDQEFSGCRFADRCDVVMDVCRHVIPFRNTPSPGREVYCHLAESGLTVADQGREAAGDLQPEREPADADLGSSLSVRDLRVHFPIHKGVFRRVVGHVRAVDGVTLEIPRGRTLALVGESGCGKTTLGKGILQLIRPTGGAVDFEGDDLTALSNRQLRTRRRDFQIIFQDPFSSMNPRMRVGDIIQEGLQAQQIGENDAARQERVRKLLEQVGLSAGVINRYPHEFSGGQRQRICIARALAVEPRLIVCDEPTSALDVSVQAQILNLLADLQGQLELTYLFITHNISVVAYLAHEVAVMYLGRIVEHGSVKDVLESPRHPYTQALLSAVPGIDPDTRHEVIQLAGDLPSPANPPSGCHFHQRCIHAKPKCSESYPESVQLSDTHRASCFLYGNKS